ncbi:MAG: adenosylmethionine decarboxylase [Chloroflexi bacterium]|nr:adenosylmethionine decarboxylase [Chloroflexota bacterium]
MTGLTMLLDLHDCKSPVLGNETMLEQLLVSALQIAGLTVVDQLSHRFPAQGARVLCVLREGHAALHTQPGAGAVAADVMLLGAPEAARAALEIVRGYLAQKLIARSVQARVIERGTNGGA